MLFEGKVGRKVAVWPTTCNDIFLLAYRKCMDPVEKVLRDAKMDKSTVCTSVVYLLVLCMPIELFSRGRAARALPVLLCSLSHPSGPSHTQACSVALPDQIGGGDRTHGIDRKSICNVFPPLFALGCPSAGDITA